MEHLVLKVLGFNLSVPTSFLFLNKMVEMVPVEEDEEEDKAKVGALAAFLAELALVDGETFLKYPPSQVADLLFINLALSRLLLITPAVYPHFVINFDFSNFFKSTHST